LHYNQLWYKKGFYISRVLKISRYYFLDNFMENFKKTKCQINLQFLVFTHIAQISLRADSKAMNQ
jgi:hypothetical protein